MGVCKERASVQVPWERVYASALNLISQYQLMSFLIWRWFGSSRLLALSGCYPENYNWSRQSPIEKVSVASMRALARPNIAGGSGERALWVPPPPSGVLRGLSPLEKILKPWTASRLAKIEFKLATLLPLKTEKSQQIEESLHFLSPLIHRLLSKQAVAEVGIKTTF